jgi:hypothetical protein
MAFNRGSLIIRWFVFGQKMIPDKLISTDEVKHGKIATTSEVKLR